MLSRAAILSDFRVGPAVVDVTVPSLKPGEILVEVDAAPLGLLDVGIVDGRFGSDAILPLIMGREGSGRILETKARTVDVGGTPLEPGQRIVWTHPWCGHCRACALNRQPTLCENGREYGRGPSPSEKLNGTFSEYVIVDPDSKVLVVPDALDPVLVATATNTLGSVIHALAGGPRLRFSDHVAVIGAGERGLFAAAIALSSGVSGVHLVGGSEVALDVVGSWGLSSRFDVARSTPEERLQEISDRTGGLGCDLVIDCADDPEGPESRSSDTEGLGLLRHGGTYFSLGRIPRGDPLPTTPGSTAKQFNVVQAHSADGGHLRDAVAFLECCHQRLSLTEVIAGNRHFPLDDVVVALDARRDGGDSSPVILPTS